MNRAQGFLKEAHSLVGKENVANITTREQWEARGQKDWGRCSKASNNEPGEDVGECLSRQWV